MNKSAQILKLLLMGAVTLTLGATGSGTTSRATEPVVTKGPRAWALATTALLTHRNSERLDMLSPRVRNPSNVSDIRAILHDWWGIDSRSGLLQDLESPDREGHRATFHRVGQSLLSMTDTQYYALLRSHREKARIKLTREHFRRHRQNSLVAWDYCRYIMLCRWGYTVGFLTEDEAWRRIMPAARMIQGSFRSWAELGEDYLAGREFWSREETARTGQMYRDIEEWLVRKPQSPWNQLPWKMDLGPGIPQS